MKRLFVALTILSLLCSIGTAAGDSRSTRAKSEKNNTNPYGIVVYTGKLPSDCSACHTSATLTGITNLQAVYRVEVRKVSLNRSTGTYDGLPAFVQMIPAVLLYKRETFLEIQYGVNTSEVAAAFVRHDNAKRD
jgi:hypothetical protein